MNTQPTRPVVVGCDGSADSAAAVRFAATEAQLRGTTLQVVMAYDPTVITYGFGGYVATELDEDFRGRAEAELTRVRDEVLADLDGPAPDIELLVGRGRPAQVLVDVARDAALLVVGARGHGVWGRLLLGSVSTEVVHHADVPVVVIPASKPDSSKPDSRGLTTVETVAG
jgi:nucleotide-binding universal stress UspA family protein